MIAFKQKNRFKNKFDHFGTPIFDSIPENSVLGVIFYVHFEFAVKNCGLRRPGGKIYEKRPRKSMFKSVFLFQSVHAVKWPFCATGQDRIHAMKGKNNVGAEESAVHRPQHPTPHSYRQMPGVSIFLRGKHKNNSKTTLVDIRKTSKQQKKNS